MLAKNHQFRSTESLRESVTEFFWNVLTNAEKFTSKLITDCIDNFEVFKQKRWYHDEIENFFT